jgi:nascent polypeptide-associated complex subunit alpha
MLGGLGGIDPKKMQAMMKQMGIKQEEIDALRVIIEKEDGKIIIENPSVAKITMQGTESWQITGEAREEETGISEGDVKLVMEKTGKSEKEARAALQRTQDLAEAILELSE